MDENRFYDREGVVDLAIQGGPILDALERYRKDAERL